MAPKPKGQHRRLRSAPRRSAKVKAALLTPVVPIEQVQNAAAKLRPAHPALDDDTVALCVLTVTTRLSTRAIAKELGASNSWCYARLIRPEVQTFLQQLATTSLGVAASRSIQTLQFLSENSPDEAMRRACATELLDRAGIGNTSSMQQAGVSQPYAFSFAAPPQPKAA